MFQYKVKKLPCDKFGKADSFIMFQDCLILSDGGVQTLNIDRNNKEVVRWWDGCGF